MWVRFRWPHASWFHWSCVIFYFFCFSCVCICDNVCFRVNITDDLHAMRWEYWMTMILWSLFYDISRSYDFDDAFMDGSGFDGDQDFDNVFRSNLFDICRMICIEFTHESMRTWDDRDDGCVGISFDDVWILIGVFVWYDYNIEWIFLYDLERPLDIFSICMISMSIYETWTNSLSIFDCFFVWVWMNDIFDLSFVHKKSTCEI